MDAFSHVPPGFRFHPSDEELVDYYLRKKIASKKIDLDVIKDVDLYRIEPWDLQELCKLGSEEQSEWYFFSHKDKKYPTGTRTNRATKAGFWKATGRDKAIYARHCLVGMRKTLVFYKGRAPNGQKSDWIMHEYRLETNENGTTTQEEGWVVCRVFKKRMTTVRKMSDYESPCWYDDQVSFMPELDSPRRSLMINSQQNYTSYHDHYYSCKQETELQNNMHHHDHDCFLQLPHLESPKLPTCMLPNYTTLDGSSNTMQSSALTQNLITNSVLHSCNEQATDWRVLDKFVASQLSHEDASKETNGGTVFGVAQHMTDNIQVCESKRPELTGQECAGSSCQIELWK